MRKNDSREAVWSWQYNYGRSYSWPCNRCGALVEMEKIDFQNQPMYVKCPVCNYKKQKYSLEGGHD